MDVAQDGDDIIDLQPWDKDRPIRVKPNGKLLVVLDVNETLLFRKYQSNGTYTTPIIRPFAAEFIRRLLEFREAGIIHLGTWCGAWTHQREGELLTLLEERVGLMSRTRGRGRSKVLKNLDLHIRALPGCKTRHTFQHNPGKMVVIKPVSMLRSMVPQY